VEVAADGHAHALLVEFLDKRVTAAARAASSLLTVTAQQL